MQAKLESKTARTKLAPGVKPHYRAIEPGLHLGYRRNVTGPGSWIVRRFAAGKYTVTNLRTADGALVVADDYSEADGERIMTFADAQNAARGRKASTAPGRYTVDQACDDYLEWLKNDGRTPAAIGDARYRLDAFVRPTLGGVRLADLTADRLRKWRNDLASTPARLRTRDGEEQKHRPVEGERGQTARRATAARIWTVFRAVLNRAWRNDKAPSPDAWKKVEAVKGIDISRERHLSLAEAKRLLNACEPAFRPVLNAALLTGARYGQIIRLVAGDYDTDAATIRLQTRKGDGTLRIFHAHLTDEGRQFFDQATAGKASTELIFKRPDGSAWDKSHQVRPIAAASARAKISPPATFHTTRHTYASLAIAGGVNLLVIATNLGHRDTRMIERHYGHLARKFAADSIRKGVPEFGFNPSSVRAIR